jgi:hypothetical protein
VPWDFFYEHCSLFSAGSLALALERAGFVVTDVRHVFGGQYLWAEAVSGREQSGITRPTGRRGPCPGLDDRLASWDSLLEQLAPRGTVYVWGAGAKGVTFCNLADPDASRLAGVIDVNPAKQGKFVPGTGHTIVPPAHATDAVAVLVLNPNYVAEVRADVTRRGSRAEVLDLMQEATPCGS